MSQDLPKTCLILSLLLALCASQSSVLLDWTEKMRGREMEVKHFQLTYSPQIGSLPFDSVLPADITQTEIENALPATNYSVVLQAILAGSSALSPLQPFVLLNRTYASSPDAPMFESVQLNCTNATLSFFPPDGEDLSYFAEYFPTGRQDAARFLEFNSTSFMLRRLRPYVEYQVKLKAVFRGIPSKYGANTSFVLDVNGTDCNDSVIPFAQPQTISAVREGRSLRIEWDKPDDPEWGVYDCSEYKVNYTVMTLRKPKSFIQIVPGNRQYLLIKLLRNHLLRMEVSCNINETLRSGVPGVGFADLREPEQPRNFRVVKADTDAFFRSSVVLNFSWPALHDYEQFPLIVSYYPGKARKLRKDIQVDHPQAVNVSGLKPSMDYVFAIRNISAMGFESKPVQVRQITPPIISSSMEVVAKTTTMLQFKITPTTNEEAKFSQYVVVFVISPTQNSTKRRIPSELKSKVFEYSGLTPGQTYPVYLYTEYQKEKSRPVVARFTTYPLAVKRTMPIVTRDLVKLYWEPEDNNGKIPISYKLSYSGSDGSELGPITLANQSNYTFPELVPDVWFTFTIVVVMGATESDSEALTVVTGFNDAKVPILRRVSAEKVEVGLRPDFFTESNGEVVRYALVVAEDYAADRLPEKYPTWFDVQDEPKWPPFQATPDDWQPFSRLRDEEQAFIVGNDRCDKVRGYCNGPLKPNTEFYVKLRACTKDNICMDTDYAKAHTDPSNRLASQIEFLNGNANSPSSKLYFVLFQSFFSVILARLL